MGVYYKNLYKPDDGETGWGGLIDVNWDYLGDRNMYVVKTADETVTSSTTLQDDNELFFFMSANGVWLVTSTILIDTNGLTGGGFLFGLSVPTGATARWSSNWTVGGTSLPALMLTEASTAAAGSTSATTANLGGLKYHYVVTSSTTTGNFQYRWCQNSSSANPTYVRKNSMLEVKKVV